MSQSKPWRRKFFTIWIGQQLSLVGSSIGRFALIWWITKKTGSATVLATAAMVSLIPGVLLGPFAGALIDRWNRRRVIILSDGFIALVSLWLAYLFWSGTMQIWHIYVVMLARSFGGAFHDTAIGASTTLLVPKEHYTRIGGLNHTITGILSLIGPPLGALALALLPLHGVMLIDVGTAAFAVLPLLFLTIPQPESNHVDAIRASSVWANTREGLRFIFRWPGLLAFVGLIFAMKIAIMPAFSLAPLLINQGFGREASGLALYQAMAGAGAIAGGLLIGAWGGFRHKMTTILVGLAGVGLGALLVGFAPASAFWLALIGGGVIGLMNAVSGSPFMAVLQATVPAQMQGRVFASLGSLLSIATPISLAVAGPISDLLGIRFFYRFGGAVCIALPLIALSIPALRQFEDQAESMVHPTETPATSQE